MCIVAGYYAGWKMQKAHTDHYKVMADGYKKDAIFWQDSCDKASKLQDETWDDMIEWRSKYLAEIEKLNTDYIMD